LPLARAENQETPRSFFFLEIGIVSLKKNAIGIVEDDSDCIVAQSSSRFHLKGLSPAQALEKNFCRVGSEISSESGFSCTNPLAFPPKPFQAFVRNGCGLGKIFPKLLTPSPKSANLSSTFQRF
jgi:hypothetical protein